MNLTSAAIVLRERTALELVDLSMRFVRSLAPLAYLRVSAAVLLPLFVSCLALRYGAGLAWGWVWLCAWIAATLAQAPFTLLAGRLLFASEARTVDILRDTLRHSLTYGVSLLARAVWLLLSLITFIGPLVVWALTAYLHEIVYLEKANLRTALGRSRRFVRGRSGASLEMIFLSSCGIFAAVVLGEVMGLTLKDFVFQVSTPMETLAADGGSVFALAGWFAAVPFTSTLRFLFYVNERTLRDGWDVQVRFLGIRDALEERAG